MIDKDGFRANVGLIICNDANQVLWAQRSQRDEWQFPQGGIKENETVDQAVYRELTEEVGLTHDHVAMLGMTQSWLRYRLPKNYIRYGNKPLCIGQKQRWFLFRLIGNEEDIKLDNEAEPEFGDWRWVDYWQPLDEVIFFKRDVYSRALDELAPLLFPDHKIRPKNKRSTLT